MGAQAQDEHRFNAAYRLHRRAIESYCRRRVDAGSVDDCVAEVFTVAWRRVDALPEDAAVLPWLYGVAANVVRNHVRSAGRLRRLRSKISSLAHPQTDTPEQHTVRTSTNEMVLSALSQLRPADQEILRLRTWEELDRHEIAAIYGISPEAADMRVTRAARRMAKAMERVGIADRYRETGRRGDGPHG